MKYQLVVQFSGETEKDFEHLIDLEGELEEKLNEESEVDGHDFGSGEMNVFILTDDPINAFNQIKTIVTGYDLSDMKVAYRNIEGEKYTVLWPNSLKDFVVT